MSTVVFAFELIDQFDYAQMHETTVVGANDGNEFGRPEFAPLGRYEVTTFVKVPNQAGTLTWNDFLSFVRAREGAYDTFLFKDPLNALFYRTEKTDADGALGTAIAAQTDFPLVHKFIDASTLKVYKDGIEAVSGWSLVGNDTAPLVRFSVAPGAGVVVTAEYDYYLSVRFKTDPLGGRWQQAAGQAFIPITLVEDYPEAHRV